MPECERGFALAQSCCGKSVGYLDTDFQNSRNYNVLEEHARPIEGPQYVAGKHGVFQRRYRCWIASPYVVRTVVKVCAITPYTVYVHSLKQTVRERQENTKLRIPIDNLFDYVTRI